MRHIAVISAVFIFLILFLALVNLYISIQLRNQYQDLEVSRITSLARLVAHYLSLEDPQFFLKNLESSFDLSHLVVYDTAGNKIYDGTSRKFPYFGSFDYLKLFKNLPKAGELRYSKDDVLYYNPEPAFFLYTKVSSTYTAINRVFQWHIFYITVSLIFISFLGFFLIRNLFLPMRYVAGVAQRYGIEIKKEDFVSETFNEIFKRIKTKEKELIEFSAYVAHEFRNSLATIMGLARLVEKGKKSGEEIIKECNTINKIITNLLEYARPLKLNRVEIDLNTLIEDALNRVRIPENISVVKNLQPQIFFTGDYELLLYGLINLIENGVEAMREGGKISINTCQEKDNVYISVADTGKGIAGDKLETVFTPFYSEKEKGTGLGLAYVKKIVELHNGNIEVRSEKNKGTKFTIRIPRF